MNLLIPRSHRSIKTFLAIGAGILFSIATFSFFVHLSDKQVEAADTSQFNPGNIISDNVFYNSAAMSSGDIQSFLNTKVPVCDTNHSSYTSANGTVYTAPWICLKDYSMMTTQKNADAYCSGYGASNQTAAQIIAGVAQSCGINPQVLLVLLQKEQSLITDTWPGPWQYRSATGMGCPDTAACDSQYYGLFNQLYFAARQYKMYKANPTGYSYRSGRNNTIYYNPGPFNNAENRYYGAFGDRRDINYCGSSQVYIENQATAGLYNYTPYRPNDAALNAGYGTGNICSSYGNRNFWLYFTDWFGTTQAHPIGDNVKSAYKTHFGYASSPEICGIRDNGCYQIFDKGVTIYWSAASGAHTLGGGIRAKWGSSGSEWGALGYPISDEQYGNKNGGAYQHFQGGRIYYTNDGKSFVILNNMIDRWTQSDAEWGTLGYPVGDTTCGVRDGGCYQVFQHNIVMYWSASSGAHTIAGGIRAKWGASGSEWSRLGYPITDEQYGNRDGGAYQHFQGGRIYYTNDGKSFVILSNIIAKWSEFNAEWGALGYPITDTYCDIKDNGCYQMFQNNIAVYWSAASGAHTIAGGIRAKWGASGSEWSRLGYPISDEQYGNNTAFQEFQGGRITHHFDGTPTSITYNP